MDYKEKVYDLIKQGRISKDDGLKLLYSQSETKKSGLKNPFKKIKKELIEKFEYLLTMELPANDPQIVPEDAKTATFELMPKKELNLASYNGFLKILPTAKSRGWLKISFDNPKASIYLAGKEDKFFLDYNQEQFKYIYVEALVPDDTNLFLRAVQGPVEIQSFKSNYVEVYCLKGAVLVSNSYFKTGKIEAVSSPFICRNLRGKVLNLAVSNFRTDLIDYDIEELNISNFNSQTILEKPGFFNDNYNWNIRVTNGDLEIKGITIPKEVVINSVLQKDSDFVDSKKQLRLNIESSGNINIHNS